MPPTDDGTGPVFVPISLAADVAAPITTPTTVNFSAQISGSTAQPTLTVTFYEMSSQPTPVMQEADRPQTKDPAASLDVMTMKKIPLSNPPTPVWSGNCATFSYDIDQDFVSMLSSSTQLIGVSIEISGSSSSLGLFTIAVDFPL